MSVNINDVGTLKIRPVNHGTKKSDWNGYCGPSVISILTGMTTAESAKVINASNGNLKHYVKATNIWEMSNGFFACGIDMAKIKIPKNIKTLNKWLDDTEYSRKDNIYLVASSNHWLIIQGNNYVCGMTKNIINMKTSENTFVNKMRRTHLQEIYLLKSSSKGVKIPAHLLIKDKSKIKPYNKVKAFQKKHPELKLSYDVETFDSEKTYFVGSDTLEKIADNNPQIDDYRDERYHIVYSWDEVLEEFHYFRDYYNKHKHLEVK
jgi:hypothetical protein